MVSIAPGCDSDTCILSALLHPSALTANLMCTFIRLYGTFVCIRPCICLHLCVHVRNLMIVDVAVGCCCACLRCCVQSEEVVVVSAAWRPAVPFTRVCLRSLGIYRRRIVCLRFVSSPPSPLSLYPCLFSSMQLACTELDSLTH